MPGTTMPAPKTLPRLCVTQTRLPSRSAIEKDVVWLSLPLRPVSRSASIARSGRSPACRRARAGAGLRRGCPTGARRASAATARCWRCARRRRAGSRAAPCRHARRELRPSLREVEAFEDAQGKQELEAFAGRRRHMDRAAAIGDRQRIGPVRLHGHKIVHGRGSRRARPGAPPASRRARHRRAGPALRRRAPPACRRGRAA